MTEVEFKNLLDSCTVQREVITRQHQGNGAEWGKCAVAIWGITMICSTAITITYMVLRKFNGKQA